MALVWRCMPSVQLIQRPIECEDVKMHRSAPATAEHHAFPVEKRCVNERLVAHGGMQKYSAPMRAEDHNAKCVDSARISGESWRDRRIVAAHPLLDDRSLVERLWKMADRMLRIC
jgi:hypothetical protein